MHTTNANKENPFLFYLSTLLYMFTALLIRVAVFAPLAVLFLCESGSPLRYLALLTPLLLLFLVLPLRFSFAEALIAAKDRKPFLFGTAFNFRRYGEKLSESVLHLLRVLLWGIPLAAMLVFAYFYQADTDAFTLLNSLSTLGKNVTAIYGAVANFFIGLFGGEALLFAGGTMEGIFCLLAVLGLGVAVLLYGAVRNSAYRYLWVVASAHERNPRTDARRRLRGRRWAQLLIAFINLVLWLPFLVLAASTLKPVVSDLSTMLMTAIVAGSMPAIDLMSMFLPLMLIFLGLYLTLLPVRRVITAVFATHDVRRKHTPHASEHAGELPAASDETTHNHASAV